ncbi:PREDICTED: unconventional prefoldin RPB5 interactor-like protein [Eufriesea mexicana]|uniref:unconventional prefoldin RPB5 interactor-like protein n=1 Tax=Eufriesea mexicana TaxID=516756 RepID=UPI00083C2756|nr:PREDICTED: unconventional prefoldin RPB5 interactor-like protein [Eufriesea mexicana]
MNVEDSTQIVHRVLLDEALTKGIERNEEQCKIWTAYKKNHQKVAEALEIFQKDLYVNCMVPIGKRALMKGKLIHTNEILTCLGDGYFAKYSTSGAVALCERRIKKADEILNNLNAERNLYETRMIMLENNFFEDSDGSEIVEHWNEDQITEWKKRHREREREYHQKLAKLRLEERRKIETEEDLFNRLDQLEIEEELADEFNRLENEKYEFFGEELEEEESYYESESCSESEEEKEPKEEDIEVFDSDTKQPNDFVKSRKIKKFVLFAKPEHILNKQEENLRKEKEEDSKSTEDLEGDNLLIEFHHSENNPIVKSDGDSIETPADIYRLFFRSKSILKRSPNDINPEQPASSDYSMEEEKEEEETIKSSAYEAVVKDIQERNTTVTNKILEKEENNDTRLVSKFKRDRQSRQQ